MFKRALLATCLTLALPALAGAADLQLKRVVLSTGGLAYLEHEVEIDGTAELELIFKRDQIDDALKSLVVFDAVGSAAVMRFPSEETARDALRGLPLRAEQLKDPAEMLNALVGAEVELGTPARTIAGRVSGVSTVPTAAGSVAVNRQRVTVMTEDGLVSAMLDEVTTIRFRDRSLQERITAGLRTLSRSVDADSRRVTLESRGEGRRRVRIGYLVEAPVWKASYRLTLDGGDKGRLQGWAVLENLTGTDWTNVQLEVVSGSPVAFRQALSEPIRSPRPVVPIEVIGRPVPPADTGTVPSFAAMAAAAPSPAPQAAPQAAARPAAVNAQFLMSGARESQQADRAVEVTPQARIEQAAAREADTQVVYRMPRPVTVPARDSAMMAIIDASIPIEQVAHFARGSTALNPFSAVRLTNDTGSSLPPGAITIYQRADDGSFSHVGDARISATAPAATRLLAFAADPRVQITRSDDRSEQLSLLAWNQGFLQRTVMDEVKTVFALRNTDARPRTLVLDMPAMDGWELKTPGSERIENGIRFTQRLAAGETRLFEVLHERPRLMQMGIDNLDGDQLRIYARSTRLPATVQRSLMELAAIWDRFLRAQEEASRLQGELNTEFEEQARLRSNIAAISAPDLQKTYLDQMRASEQKIATIRVGLGRAQTDVSRIRTEFDRAVREKLSR